MYATWGIFGQICLFYVSGSTAAIGIVLLCFFLLFLDRHGCEEMEMERMANFVCATKGVFFLFLFYLVLFFFHVQGFFFFFYRQSKMGQKNSSSWFFTF